MNIILVAIALIPGIIALKNIITDITTKETHNGN